MTSVTKSNASPHASVLWDEVVASVAAEFPDVSWQSMLVDAAAARLVLAPQEFDVIVASNLHGDILSDLTGALAGSLGMAPSANLSLDRLAPVDVRARPRLGVRSRRSRAWPTPSGWCSPPRSCSTTSDAGDSAERVRRAVASACADGVLTPDVGGRASTGEVADAILSAL